MPAIQSYNYSVSAMYIKPGSKPIEISSDTIASVIIDNNYEKNNMPVIFLSFKCRSEMYNDMIVHKNSASIILAIDKFVTGGSMRNHKNYIREEFSYIIPSTPDTNRELDGGIDSVSYKNATIGLYHIGFVNEMMIDDPVDSNMIIKNTDMQSIVHHFTRHMPMIVERFDRGEKIPFVVIPPISSLKSLLEYLNKVYAFYNGDYVFYRDFNTAYLLSGSRDVKTNVMQHSDIIIRLMDSAQMATRFLSVDVNKDRDAYIINVDASRVSIVEDNVTDKKFSSLLAINPNGDSVTIETDVNFKPDERNTKKMKIVRTPNTDLKYSETMAHMVKERSFMLQFSKTEIDSDIFTPNRVYNIQNFSTYSFFNGRYKIMSKKDVLIRQSDSYISNTILSFCKLDE